MSDALRVKLIGKGHKHRDTAQTKVTLREVVEVAKTFSATVFANQLVKTFFFFNNFIIQYFPYIYNTYNTVQY